MFASRFCTLCFKIVPRSTAIFELPVIKNRFASLIYKTNPIIQGNIICQRYVHTSPVQQAKGKDRKKENKGKKKVQINETQLSESVDVEKLRHQLERCVDDLKNEYGKKLSLRSTTGSIESLRVTVDGREHALQEVAQIVRKNPQLVVVNMAAFPGALPAAARALRDSGLGLNPQQDGSTLYVAVPRVTREHREQLAKAARAAHVRCRDAVRDVQTQHSRKLKRDAGLSQDLARMLDDQIGAIADQHVTAADQVLALKLEELLGQS